MENQLIGVVVFIKNNLNSREKIMDFKKYQSIAEQTDKNPKKSNLKSEIIPLLGLVGEAGVLLSEYKKKLRDGKHYTGFKESVKEELGDLLWYVSNLATKFDLDLNEIAQSNLKKTKEHWCKSRNKRKLYDANLPLKQKLPRTFSYKFYQIKNGKKKIRLKDAKTNKDIGELLTDNSYEENDYRYHDVMHMTFMACFGWSPVFRKLLRSKKLKIIKNRTGERSEVEDGGRAQIIEEAIIHLIYVYASQNNFLQSKNCIIDWQFLRLIKNMTSGLEVSDKTTYDWNKALKLGFKNWKKLIDNNGGIIEGDLNKGTINYKKLKKH